MKTIPAFIKIIVEELKDYKPEKIILFGSAARSEWNENSDLDFLLIKKNEKENGRQDRRCFGLFENL